MKERKFTTSTEGTVFGADANLNGRITIEIPLGLQVPPTGVPVTITWERQPTREEAVRQVIHESLTNDARFLGLNVVEYHTGGAYQTAEGPIDVFSEITRRVLDAIEEAQ